MVRNLQDSLRLAKWPALRVNFRLLFCLKNQASYPVQTNNFLVFALPFIRASEVIHLDQMNNLKDTRPNSSIQGLNASLWTRLICVLMMPE